MTKILKKIKWFLVAIGVLGIALAGVDTKTADKKLVESIESIKKISNDKYEQIKEVKTTVDKQEITYKVHEYVTSKGEAGYQIIMKWTDDEGEHTKSVGYGVEADSRTFHNIKNTTATSTQ
ncbi:MAG: hypothetical protein K9M15_01580 [Candidatus Marinimicrobia bacterium]|nr:hypothetical protein [Candidatus Neomarinimicrobiota bacterium]